MRALLISLSVILSLSSYAQEPMYDICPVKNSTEVPSAKVYQVNGEEVDLKEYVGNKKAILVFYRGGWCPYCMRHLSALQEVKSEIDDMGFELIAITPDNFSQLDSSIKRSKGTEYKLFSDKDISAITAFGIGWKVSDEQYSKYKEKYKLDLEWWSGSEHHVLPVPSVFIINEGNIKFQHVDPKYSQRLSPELLLSFLKAI